MQNKNQIIQTVGFIIIIILILSAFVYFNKAETPTVVDNNISTSTTTLISTSTASTTIAITIDKPIDIFAKCIASKNLTMYGAVWCSHCLAEKKAFGEAFRFINYVECPDNIKLCTEKGINGYPTWIDGAGKKYEGEQGLKGLAEITGCELPTKAL